MGAARTLVQDRYGRLHSRARQKQMEPALSDINHLLTAQILIA